MLVPLLGWGIAELFALTTPAFIALVLIACSPGAPFGVKVAVTAGGDVVTASSLQILIAVIGSFTFPITANWILSAADMGEEISLPVGRLVGTIVVLQIIPFIVGMAVRNWAPQTAGGWLKSSMKVSGMTFFAVLALALLGGWQEIVDLIGSRTMVAALVFTVIALAVGVLVATGPARIRTTVGILAPNRNAGPVFAAVGIAFANDPAILGATLSIMMVGLVVSILFGSFLARKRRSPRGAGIDRRGGSGVRHRRGERGLIEVGGTVDRESTELKRKMGRMSDSDGSRPTQVTKFPRRSRPAWDSM